MDNVLTVIIIFVIAAGESLLLVGLFVPGVALLGAAVLYAQQSAVPVEYIVTAAVLGAFSGDGISFVIGQRIGPAMSSWAFFRARPALWEKGMNFFYRYGWLSIALGRFIGPVRPLIPAIAGVFGMRPQTFWLVNAISSVAWGIAYVAPVLWFGSSDWFTQALN